MCVGGGGSDSRLDVRKRGGGHSDAYRVQQGGGGVYKLGKNAYVINGRPLKGQMLLKSFHVINTFSKKSIIRQIM